MRRFALDPALTKNVPTAPTMLRPTIIKQASRFEIDEATKTVRSMSTDRHIEFFDAAKKLAMLGLSNAEVRQELLSVAGVDKKMRKKVVGALNSLEKYGLIKSG